MKAIADTGFLVAFGNRNDRHHAWVVEIAERITEPLLTREAVLAEAAFHLGSASLVLVRLSELHPKHPVITTDLNDFRVYRRGQREAIPLIHPPVR
ncbi:MAG: hypothetical protein ABSH05_15130 [Bryobacteraceae bacterium]|jgi:predicted nucleic acid-binding protein